VEDKGGIEMTANGKVFYFIMALATVSLLLPYAAGALNNSTAVKPYSQDLHKDISEMSLKEAEAIAKLLTDIKASAEGISETLRGEGMAKISEADLAKLVHSNVDLQAKLKAATDEIADGKSLIRKAEEDKQALTAVVAKLEGAIRQFVADRDAFLAKTNETATIRFAVVAENANDPTPAMKKNSSPQPPAVVSVARSERSPDAQANAKLPFTVVGITDAFVVVEIAPNEFRRLQTGQSLAGVTITAIDASKNRITTSSGSFGMRTANSQ
jgi:hypothetical protein